MALIINRQLPGYARPYPKIGCGLVFCFEEDDYTITTGTFSQINIELNNSGAGGALVTDGDTMILHGYLFTFVAGPPKNLFEIQIAAGSATATNLLNNLNLIPFFRYNYTLSNSSAFVVRLTNTVKKVDPAFGFEVDVANTNAIRLQPGGTFTAGTNNIYKDDYYVSLRIKDQNSGKFICSDPISKPINFLEIGNPKVCFDVQALLERYPLVYTSPPAPYQSLYPGAGKLDNFDENYQREFQLEIWNSYTEDLSRCEKTQSDFIEITGAFGNPLKLVNFIHKGNTCQTNAFFNYSFNPGGSFTQEFITVMPSEFTVCQESAVELRFMYDVAAIATLSGTAYIECVLNYTDGSSDTFTQSIGQIQNGCHVANLSFSPDALSGATVIVPGMAGKTIQNVRVNVFHIIMAVTTQYLKTYLINFRITKSDFVKCQCSTAFYFVSSVGNNDLIIGREVKENFEVEFYDACFEQKCCETYLGVNEKNTGKVDAGVNSVVEKKTAIIEAPLEYLKEFLLSPIKYEYDRDNNTVYLIRSLKKSYTIRKGDKRLFIQFEYERTIRTKHFKR